MEASAQERRQGVLLLLLARIEASEGVVHQLLDSLIREGVEDPVRREEEPVPWSAVLGEVELRDGGDLALPRGA
eukprot:6752544-Alexandrium_andersonii.AAC.1